MHQSNSCIWCLIFVGVLHEVITVEDEYNTLYKDGSYEFGYTNPDSYHYADGNRNNVVKGEFGGRNPKTGAIDSTVYTAGPRGYRPRGKNVARKYDLSQSGPRAIGSPDDPYYDPYEDPSYSFSIRTRTYNRDENANRFVSAGPDQRRTEVSDSTGHVRGSYTYLDDKGVQHSVHYIAGPETGYRILKQVKGPHLPTVFPFGRPDIIPPDFYDYDKDYKDVFDTAASGHVRPGQRKKARPTGGGKTDTSSYDDNEVGHKPRFGDKSKKPSYDEDEEDTGDFGDLFGGSSTPSPRPGGDRRGGYKPSTPKPPDSEEDGSYKPSGDDGSYNPSSTTSRPGDGSTRIPEEPDRGGGGYPSGPKPSTSFEDGGSSSGGDNFGLFGSETNHPKPPRPYGDGPKISVRPYDDRCPKCDDTIITNLGDSYLTVPPGVSVRAHVQAIDLLPLTPKLTLSILLIAQLTYSSEEPSSRQKRRAFVPFFINRPITPHPDPEYRLNIETGNYKRQEMSDGHGNIKGRYTYWNEGGEHTLEYFAGQDARFLSAAMTLPLADRPVVVPKYFFIPRHIYPCTTNHSKEELKVEPLLTTESSSPTPTTVGSTEASTGQSTEESMTTVGSSDTTNAGAETTVGSSETTTVAA
ncbi:unnamed protein product [Callosobruchus maculatus]|uniref:Uncharacterized protein n=1 Tax=Callosobruchus maculatus TaxID=64391 RepID=A0A653DWL6_CALMS|nr:unnamed protein product [Callosobruchus maculatus]